MPNFQGAMNTMLGMAAAAATLNPDLKAEREAKTAETKAKKLEEAYKGEVDKAKKILSDPENPVGGVERTEAENTVSEANKALQEAREEALSKNPTAKRAENVVQGRIKSTSDDRMMSGYALGAEQHSKEIAKQTTPVIKAAIRGMSRDETKMEEANNTSQKQVKAKASQRRNFKTYLAQQPTSLGGTVDDLPSDLQKKIASQYSRSDRKRMMDQMDREVKNGKQE